MQGPPERSRALATTVTTLVLLLTLQMTTCNAARFHMYKNPSNSTDFIAANCKATTYQRLCVDSLSPYNSTIHDSPLQLARTALSVSLAAARSTLAAIAKLAADGGLRQREAAAVTDCKTTTQDAVEQLKRSLDDMAGRGAGGRKVSLGLRMADIQTWVSAALTDEYTCMMGLAGRGIMAGGTRVEVRRQIENVVQLTSNALALVCALGSK